MRPVPVVIADEFRQHRRQVLLIEDDQVVETLAPERADNAFGDRVRTRRSNGCSDGIDADPAGPLPEVAPVDRIPIP